MYMGKKKENCYIKCTKCKRYLIMKFLICLNMAIILKKNQ